MLASCGVSRHLTVTCVPVATVLISFAYRGWFIFILILRVDVVLATYALLFFAKVQNLEINCLDTIQPFSVNIS